MNGTKQNARRAKAGECGWRENNICDCPHCTTPPAAIQTLLNQAKQRMANDPARRARHRAIWRALLVLVEGER